MPDLLEGIELAPVPAPGTRLAPLDCTGREIHLGDYVVIIPGSVITGSFPGPAKISKARRPVRVHAVSYGWTKISDHRDDGERAPRITYVGASSYWHDVDAALTEIVG